jgi:hypothetical protein
MLKIYWKYLKYIMQHKYFVAIECLKMGLYLHAITHDLSKFRPSEFFPYAEKFFSGDYAYKYFYVESRFEMAWLKHQRRNPHHWDYWVDSSCKSLPMPRKYVLQMVADWNAMGRKFGDTAKEFYLKNQSKMKLHHTTRDLLDKLLCG